MNEIEKGILFRGKFLNLVKKEGWEFVERVGSTGIVAIVAITDQNELILVEQYRAPVGKRVIELPAGLVGDVKGEESEELVKAAQRELLEETGYEASQWSFLTEGPPSAGLSSEVISFFKARNLKRIHEGGGDGNESIQVHMVPLSDIKSWLRKKEKEGALIDYKIYAGLYFIECDKQSSN
jgi:ADP-ribose pyrophosphatase